MLRLYTVTPRTAIVTVLAVIGLMLLASCGGGAVIQDLEMEEAANVIAEARRAPTDEPAPPVEPGRGDPETGQRIFQGEAEIDGFLACKTCHSFEPGKEDLIAPNLLEVSIQGETRIPGVSADEYIRRSIRVHDDYVVEGYEPGLLVSMQGKDYQEVLTDGQTEHLVAFLMSLDMEAVAQASTAPEPIQPSSDDIPAGLVQYLACIDCHNQHTPDVVLMPHPVAPQCRECHSGTPQRIGCPSCHSMHAVDVPHPNDPDLTCESCH